MALPHHIAIIPDGNRRWAKQRGLPAFFGHREGAKTTEKVLKYALKQGVTHLTFWGASINNVTKRDEKEVRYLFDLFTKYFQKIQNDKFTHKNEVHIEVLGRWADYFPSETQKAIKAAVAATKKYTKFHLTILLAYNGTEEMLTAINSLVAGALPTLQATTIPPSGHAGGAGVATVTVNEKALKDCLYTRDLPAVDLVIRTGDEPHLSTGFMMWDTADAQLYFSKRMWPDFLEPELQKALDTYAATERRAGK